MKSLSILFSLILISTFVNAQDAGTSSYKNEFYVKPSGLFNLSNIGLEYKRQLTEAKYFKIGVQDISFGINTQNQMGSIQTMSHFNGQMTTGLEYRKPIAGQLNFIHGPGLGFNFGKTVTTLEAGTDPVVKTTTETTTNLGGAFLYTLGVLHPIKSRLLVGAEIAPNISFVHSSTMRNVPAIPENRINLNVTLIGNSKFLVAYRF